MPEGCTSILRCCDCTIGVIYTPIGPRQRSRLPLDWAEDSKRRRKTGVPEDVCFKTKPEIALEQIEAACKAGLPRGVVLMDAGYGCNTDLRTGVSALGLRYVAGILPNTSVWASGTGPLPPKKWSGQGRPPKLIRRDDKHRPISVKQLALSTCPSALGARSSGAKARPSGCPRALRACGFVSRIAITISPTAGRKNGC